MPIQRQPSPQAGPSRKRGAEVIDIDADEDNSDIKPDNKARLATRVGWLEVSDERVFDETGLIHSVNYRLRMLLSSDKG
jgi:hypothetical protein